jgi:hypothetical protein
MRKILLVLTLSFCIIGQEAKSQEDGKFFEDVLISKDIKLEEKSSGAKDRASRLLDSKPKTIKIEGAPPAFRPRQNPAAPAIAAAPVDTATKYGEAPFGMSWGATYNQTKALGVDMERVELKDYANNFIVTKLPKPIPEFERVIVSFADDNMLWRLIAYGKPFDDDAQASKALKQYRKYYKLLSQKYGNAKQFFDPKVTTIEKTIEDDMGRPKVEITYREEPMGGTNFLEELKTGEATLYATFEDREVGAALTLKINDEGQSYIIIDYTNLRIYKEREDKTLNAL